MRISIYFHFHVITFLFLAFRQKVCIIQIHILIWTCQHEHTGLDHHGIVRDERRHKVCLCHTALQIIGRIGFMFLLSFQFDGISPKVRVGFIMLSCTKLCSVRVSNELGAVHPRTAKFSLVVAVITSTLIGLLLALVLIISRDDYPSFFSNDVQVEDLVKELTPLLALCIIINNVQPVLSGNNINILQNITLSLFFSD